LPDNKFELEQVLKYRLEVERLKKQEFAEAKQGLEKAEDRLLQEQERTLDLSRRFDDIHDTIKDIEEMRRYADFFARKRREIGQQKERIEHLGLILNERREVLLEATKDKKVLESLKERKIQEFRLAMDQKEQLFMDEIAVQKKDGIK
jgi:flagellar FliJ protein